MVLQLRACGSLEQVLEFEVPHCFDEFVGLAEAILRKAVAYGDDFYARGFGGGDASW